MISWGIALLAHVGVRNKEGIYATRFLLGLVRLMCTPSVICVTLTATSIVRSGHVPCSDFSAHILVSTR
jgi:hypothetical protein